MKLIARTSHQSLSPFAFAFLLQLAFVGTTSAQSISYVRDLDFGAIALTLPLTQAPVDRSDPLYDSALPDLQWLVSTDHDSYEFDAGAGAMSIWGLPDFIQVDEWSLQALTGIGTSAPKALILGIRNTLSLFDRTTRVLLQRLSVPLYEVHSIAAPDRTHLTAIATATAGSPVVGHTIDLQTGAATEVFGLNGEGSAPGQFSAAYYHTYGPNGLLYVLDYGNNRVQSLDPDNAYAPVSQFSFAGGVTTANMQFAIGSNGTIYLGDGLGGGTAYTSGGSFLGAFALPVAATPPPNGVTPYISTDQTGAVFVFDATGFHQYLDQAGVIDQMVPCAGPRPGVSWKNHGQYVAEVIRVATSFLANGIITREQRDAIVRTAARSDCGVS
jgi:hypothetical protein